MKDIIYQSSDGTLQIRLQFIVVNRLRNTHLGKSWPKHTQCLMFTNGLLDCFETIVKHQKDQDNQVFAYRLVAEKCLKNISNKWMRTQVRTLLNEELRKKIQ